MLKFNCIESKSINFRKWNLVYFQIEVRFLLASFNAYVCFCPSKTSLDFYDHNVFVIRCVSCLVDPSCQSSWHGFGRKPETPEETCTGEMMILHIDSRESLVHHYRYTISWTLDHYSICAFPPNCRQKLKAHDGVEHRCETCPEWVQVRVFFPVKQETHLAFDFYSSISSPFKTMIHKFKCLFATCTVTYV